MRSRWLFPQTNFWTISQIESCPVSSHCRNMRTTISYVPHIMPGLPPKLSASYPITADISILAQFQIMHNLVAVSECQPDPKHCVWLFLIWHRWLPDVRSAISGRCLINGGSSSVQLSCTTQITQWAHLRSRIHGISYNIQPVLEKTHLLVTGCFRCPGCWIRLLRLTCRASTSKTGLQYTLNRRATPKHCKSACQQFVA